ncbi:hypothetical protein BB561_005584 [Smittium simulii]|uniref:Uncharacterized protein n=1 Tax=Smittium simulii TaxID=133385 RepID=A0A2T9Y9N1_9FUNG|nr:hypothetical protein BB561_005584 [Smittium simulii]
MYSQIYMTDMELTAALDVCNESLTEQDNFQLNEPQYKSIERELDLQLDFKESTLLVLPEESCSFSFSARKHYY